MPDPESISKETISTNPILAARLKGVKPVSYVSFTFAPNSMIAATSSNLVLLMEDCNAFPGRGAVREGALGPGARVPQKFPQNGKKLPISRKNCEKLAKVHRTPYL